MEKMLIRTNFSKNPGFAIQKALLSLPSIMHRPKMSTNSTIESNYLIQTSPIFRGLGMPRTDVSYNVLSKADCLRSTHVATRGSIRPMSRELAAQLHELGITRHRNHATTIETISQQVFLYVTVAQNSMKVTDWDAHKLIGKPYPGLINLGNAKIRNLLPMRSIANTRSWPTTSS